MAHILTDTEAIEALRITAVNEVANYEMLMSAVDDGIKTETGHDWAADTVIDPTAKLAAALLLTCLYDGIDTPSFYRYKIVQLDGKVKNGEVSTA
jgi:hypothetical protein